MGDSQDPSTGLKIHSLYGPTRRPTPEMLAGIDTLVFDIQDIGTRFYTYVSTMGEAMKAAAENNVRFVVLDRPNPINGVDVAGPVGTPVVAPAAGTVTLAEPDLYYSGGTLIIDHGHGVSSIYSHLSRVNVAVGQRVAAGEAIGAVGSTGRSTGPHLDWRINWFQLRLDPERIAGPMPQ